MTAVAIGATVEEPKVEEDIYENVKVHAYEAILEEMEAQGVSSDSEILPVNMVAVADAVVERLVALGVWVPENIKNPLTV